MVGPARIEHGRLQPTLRVILFLLTFLVLTLVLTVVATALLGPGLITEIGPESGGVVGPGGAVLATISATAAALATWLFLRAADRRPWSSVGLDGGAGWLAEVGWGLGLGALLMAGIAALEIGLGLYRLEGVAAADAAARDLLLGLVVYAAVAFGEELTMRGYVLQRLTEGWGRPVATLISSVAFAILHAGNPASGVVPLFGIFFAGLMLAQAYWATGRLWLPIGLHWAWNYFQGPVFGFSVSGTSASGVLHLTEVGPTALTGGAFGPEASLVGIGACLLGTGVLLISRSWAVPAGPPPTG